MKQKTAAAICLLLLLTASATLAFDQRVLGKSHYSFEADIMFLQHETFETDDGGGYVGLAGYGHLGNNWYLGGEIGAGFGLGLFAESSTYTPFELNVKKAISSSDHWVVDFGGGLSYNRISVSYRPQFSDDDPKIIDWVFGGQLLGDLIFKTGKFHIGLKLKYQLTADLGEVSALISPEKGWDYSNFRVGIALGFLIPE